MRRPRSSREAALFGVVAGLSPLHSCGVPLLDALYVAALGAFAGMCLAFATAWTDARQTECAGPAIPRLRSDEAFEHTENTDMDATQIDTGFLWALAGVESGHNDAAVNREEGAYGRFQIRAANLADANEALGTHYSLQEMTDPAKAMRVVRAYLGRYVPAFEARAGREATIEEMARIHNGGPRGAEKECTLAYAARFRKAVLACR